NLLEVKTFRVQFLSSIKQSLLIILPRETEKMLPIRDPEYTFAQSFNEQLEFNPHLLPNGSYFPSTPTVFCPDGFHDLFLPSNVIGIATATPTSTRPTLPLGDSATSVERQEGDGRKRGVRKCRHSKIVTASGPRDRRMRLSTDVARSFFRLQDTLGFDKASKTVEWLLTMSKAAIEELGTLSPADELSACSNRSPKSESSALVCQDSATVSSSKNKPSSTVTAAAASQVKKKSKAREGAVKPTRKAEYYHSAPAKESRAKARARARERTREKQRRMTSSDIIKEETSLNNLNSLMEFANIEEDESWAPNWCLNVATDTAYQVPMIGGGSVLIPILENGAILEEQWDVDALSLYSTTSLVAGDSYPYV
ncbi:hypothetical protein BHE74_00027189, partial [Ensete ventricosum]